MPTFEPGRPGKFTSKEIKQLTESGVVAEAAKLWGYDEDRMFSSSGTCKILIDTPARRSFADRLKAMSAKGYAAISDEAKHFIAQACGWNVRRLDVLREKGAGPVMTGWGYYNSGKAKPAAKPKAREGGKTKGKK